jgi:hypothetical protein
MKLKDRGFVEIELDKTRHLKIDFKAARLIERQLGKPLSKLNGENVGITEMVVLFWAALLHNPPIKYDWDIEKAEEFMLEAESIQYVMEKIGEAIQLFFGEGKSEKN